ncbi:MAG: N-acetylmuramoyl-L-alanine amidase [Ectothiorhodospiraceae bacterium]|nr:N-acetylmuramoyl-L-alanine amidase [Ectothiorhodospiraceae bacterium]
MKRAFVLLLLLTFSALATGEVRVEGARVWADGERTRVGFDLSGPVEHSVFSLRDPERGVIDMAGTRLVSDRTPATQGVLKAIRAAPRGDSDLRGVLDVSGSVRMQSFLVEPSGDHGHRLVVDLRGGGAEREQPVRTASSDGRRELVVAIDPGHGGRDPGAIGPSGTLEKNVVLEVGRKVAYLLEKEPGVRPLLIRDSDVFVPLAERREKARSERADIFISLHADATESGGPRGSSVYTLSQTGATSQAARLLAQRENAADMIGGVSLSDKDDLVRSVLGDLSRGATLEASVELAADLLQELATVGPIHKRDVERAGFVVLQSLDMPSVLVELAFISNPHEERLLRSPDHQWKLARSIAAGVISYAERHLPADTRTASGGGGREHVVRRGETLSGIARQHQVSVSQLRAVNNLNDDRIVVGRKLRIP